MVLLQDTQRGEIRRCCYKMSTTSIAVSRTLYPQRTLFTSSVWQTALAVVLYVEVWGPALMAARMVSRDHVAPYQRGVRFPRGPTVRLQPDDQYMVETGQRLGAGRNLGKNRGEGWH